MTSWLEPFGDVPPDRRTGRRNPNGQALDRALAEVERVADDIAEKYPSADYAGSSRQRAKRDSEHAARRANQ